jgi:uncharacterized protein (DUF58 family)
MVLASPRLAAYVAVAGACLVAGLATGEPAALAVGGAFALFLVVGLLDPAPEPPEGRCTVVPGRILEGGEAAVVAELTSPVAASVLVELAVPAGLTLVRGHRRLAVALDGGERRRLEYRLRAERWGAFPLAIAETVSWDRFGLREARSAPDARARLRAYPRTERLRRLVDSPARLVPTGAHASRLRGDGIEFAEIRPYVPGDRPRRIDWRASARVDELVVDDAHAERAADVCLFLDAFAATPGGPAGTFERAVRAAATLARSALRSRDRVGLLSFGGTLRWTTPSTGVRQLHRIAEVMIESEVERSFAWRDIDSVPRRVLPGGALVFALTPLLDERVDQALGDMRRRGHDVVVIEIEPEPAAAAGVREDAVRLWRLWREALADRHRAGGIPVVPLGPERPLAEALEEVRQWRRRPRALRG